ncbi:MAG: hypothetical protein ACFFD4_02205 [Candidatus Odinarchaeota archaeon]
MHPEDLVLHPEMVERSRQNNNQEGKLISLDGALLAGKGVAGKRGSRGYWRREEKLRKRR